MRQGRPGAYKARAAGNDRGTVSRVCAGPLTLGICLENSPRGLPPATLGTGGRVRWVSLGSCWEHPGWGARGPCALAVPVAAACRYGRRGKTGSSAAPTEAAGRLRGSWRLASCRPRAGGADPAGVRHAGGRARRRGWEAGGRARRRGGEAGVRRGGEGRPLARCGAAAGFPRRRLGSLGAALTQSAGTKREGPGCLPRSRCCLVGQTGVTPDAVIGKLQAVPVWRR